MSFDQIFKTNFLERINSFSLIDSALALIAALIIGFFIFVVYRKTYAGVMYQAEFGVSLVILTMITTFIILAVTSNVVLSLGMVGALSIVRFRTAIKDPMDLVFLFWAISVGIVLGACLFPFAFIGSALIGFVIVVFSKVKEKNVPYIVIIHCVHAFIQLDIEGEFNKKIKKGKYILKSLTQMGAGKSFDEDDRIELIYEMRTNYNYGTLSAALREIEGVEDVSVVAYNGEYI